MTDTYRGFLRQKTDGLYKVIAGRVAPESLLATECLVHRLYKLRHLVTGRVLDVGCSTKPYKPLYAGRFTQYIGVDVPFSDHSKAFIDVFGRGEHLPFRSSAFDTVLLTEVLEHVPEPQLALKEVARMLAPGGTAIVSVPFMYRIHEAPYDFFRYTPYSMRHMAQAAGLQVNQVITRGGYLTVFTDVTVKGNALIFGLLRRVLKIASGSTADRIVTAVQRAILTPLQKFQWLLLRNDTLGADRYTLGYVFIIQKVGAAASTSGDSAQ